MNDIKAIYDVIKDYIRAFYPTGSNYICNPPVTDTDVDYLILAKHKKALAYTLMENKFTINPIDYYEQGKEVLFESWRRGNINLLVMTDIDHFNKWVEATILAKKLNLLDKKQRVDLFNYVKFGEL